MNTYSISDIISYRLQLPVFYTVTPFFMDITKQINSISMAKIHEPFIITDSIGMYSPEIDNIIEILNTYAITENTSAVYLDTLFTIGTRISDFGFATSERVLDEPVPPPGRILKEDETPKKVPDVISPDIKTFRSSITTILLAILACSNIIIMWRL